MRFLATRQTYNTSWPVPSNSSRPWQSRFWHRRSTSRPSSRQQRKRLLDCRCLGFQRATQAEGSPSGGCSTLKVCTRRCRLTHRQLDMRWRKPLEGSSLQKSGEQLLGVAVPIWSEASLTVMALPYQITMQCLPLLAGCSPGANGSRIRSSSTRRCLATFKLPKTAW